MARALSLQHGLLVLDTCEHVITGAAELVTRVLRHSPGVGVLATSRRPLRITAEVAWPVPPLALPPPSARTAEEIAPFAAVTLFSDRASAARPDFVLTDATAADVAAICLALDGLPLAIELAAARADVLTPAAIRARLQNRFDLLVEGGRDLAPRQQTLRSAIDWSFELLDADQRRFFARLGAFAGSFDLDAAVSVAGYGYPDPLGLLAGLVRQSMVVVVGEDRYRLLDTLRAYALELLDDDADETRRRHARFYTELAEETEAEVRGPAQAHWLERLRADVANLRAALEWAFSAGEEEMGARLAGALAWFWTLDGMLDEAIQHLERALASPGLTALVRAKVLWGLGLVTASLGELERAREAGADSTALARDAGDDAALGYGLNALAVAEWALGDLPAAADAHDEAIQRFEAAGDGWGRAVCMVLRARTAHDAGEPAAVAMARAALPVARACGDQHVLGIALEQMARAELAAGRIHAAVAAADQALAAQESIGYTEGTIAALHLLGESQAAAGDLAEARALHVRALQLSSRIGHAAAICEAVEELARIALAEGALHQALRLLAVTRREREQRNLPLRAPDRRALDDLERSTKERIDTSAAAELTSASSTIPLAEVISELLASPSPSSENRRQQARVVTP